MRGIVDFYRRNPVVLVGAIVIGLVVSLLVATGEGDTSLSEVIAVGVVGILFGIAVAWHRNRGVR